MVKGIPPNIYHASGFPISDIPSPIHYRPNITVDSYNTDYVEVVRHRNGYWTELMTRLDLEHETANDKVLMESLLMSSRTQEKEAPTVYDESDFVPPIIAYNYIIPKDKGPSFFTRVFMAIYNFFYSSTTLDAGPK